MSSHTGKAPKMASPLVEAQVLSRVQFCAKRPLGLVVLKIFYLFWFTHSSSSSPVSYTHAPKGRHDCWPSSDAWRAHKRGKMGGYPSAEKPLCNTATSTGVVLSRHKPRPHPTHSSPLTTTEWLQHLCTKRGQLVPSQAGGLAPGGRNGSVEGSRLVPFCNFPLPHFMTYYQ